jgi:hypothetical protein
MSYAQTFIRIVLMMGLSISIYAHTEPRTEPLSPQEIREKGKARSAKKACLNMKKAKRKKHERFCSKYLA